MATNADEVFKEALALPPAERAGLVDRIISSLDSPDKNIDHVWRKEIAKRISAYRGGDIGTVSAEDILDGYRN
jgi:putative addiction module component (TIGR02574 family)